MNTADDFTVEVRRDGLLLSTVGCFPTLFDATVSALDSAERIGRAALGTHLQVVISSGAEMILTIEVVAGRRLDD